MLTPSGEGLAHQDDGSVDPIANDPGFAAPADINQTNRPVAGITGEGEVVGGQCGLPSLRNAHAGAVLTPGGCGFPAAQEDDGGVGPVSRIEGIVFDGFGGVGREPFNLGACGDLPEDMVPEARERGEVEGDL